MSVGFNGYHTGYSEDGICLEVLEPDHADMMTELYSSVSANDLAASGLDSRLADAYSDESSAKERLDILQASMLSPQPIGAYGIFETHDHSRLEGTAVFALESQSRSVQLVNRLLRNNRDNGVRLFTSWLAAESNVDPDEVMDTSLRVAEYSGLQAVRVAVADVPGSEKLTVVEHAVDVADYGFRPVGEQGILVEGKEYPSIVYQKQI